MSRAFFLQTSKTWTTSLFLKSLSADVGHWTLPIRPIFMPERAKALRADWAPGPGVFVLLDTVKQVSQSDRHEAWEKAGHVFVFTCCLRWLSVWYAALWFQALYSAEQHPEQPTWQHMEMTHLCLPSPSSLQSHGRWSPWHHKHTSEPIQVHWYTHGIHVKAQGENWRLINNSCRYTLCNYYASYWPVVHCTYVF